MRRRDLDYARGIAILLILIGHSDGMSDLEVKLIYSFHVPLFFAISGMLSCYTRAEDKSWVHIWSGWLKRLIVPTVLWEIILSGFYLVFKDVSLTQLILNSLTLNFNLSVLWFVPCLILAEAIWIAFLKAGKRYRPIVTCGLGTVVFLIASMVMPVLFLKRVLVASVFLSCGYALEKVRGKKRTDYMIRSGVMLIFVCIIWLVSALTNVKADLSAGILGNTILYYIHSTAGSVAVILVCGILPEKIPVLGWIGGNTMGFLVTHVFVRHAIIAVEEFVLGYFLDGWLLAVPMILIDMAVVWVIHRVVPEAFGRKRLKTGVENCG